jgi:uncharacterized protein YdhG (YjbR/CyaY superfamily)
MVAPPPPPSVAAAYDAAPSPHRETMLTMRERILAVVPDADEVMKYRMPTFVLDGTDVCGLLANARHVGYYPYSGSLLAGFPDLVEKYGGTKGSLHVPIDSPLPAAVIKRLVRARLAAGH